MNLHMPETFDTTTVSNRFIDRYMPAASGEYVKIYLYLLRSAQSGREFSLSAAADCFEHTEKDVKRALSYWEKQGLLRVDKSSSGEPESITLLELPLDSHGTSAPAAKSETLPEKASAPETETAAAAEPARAPLSRERLAELQARKDIKQMLFVAEAYIGRPLRPSEMNNLLYFHDTLHLSTDLIEYLIEYCVSKGCTSPQYMEKVAQSWAADGISTVSQAKQASSLYHKNYFSILKAFGIKGRNPAAPEVDYMVRWLDEYGFPVDIVIEACNRTISQTHQPNFQYANKILEKWHKAGISNVEQIKGLDAQHEQKRREQKAQNSPAAPEPKKFYAFDQRDYDYDKLEEQFLNH